MLRSRAAVAIVLTGLSTLVLWTSAAAADLEVVVDLDGTRCAVRIHPHSVRAAQYRVLLAETDGTLRAIAPEPVNTYRGTVVGEPGSIVAAALLADGLHVTRVRENARAGESLHVAELAIDADFEYFLRWGDETEARVNAIVNAINAQYERDVQVTHEISAIIVRRSPTYTTNDAIALLEQFRTRWLNEHDDVPRDLAHLLTGRHLDGGVVGIAFTGGTVCTDHGFSLARSDFNGVYECATDLSAREMGLTWGAMPCACPGTTMGFPLSCANVFAEESIQQIIAHRDTRDCLDPQGACPEDVDGDGEVDFDDVVRVLAAWGPCKDCPEDVNGDGEVGFLDLVAVLAGWGECS